MRDRRRTHQRLTLAVAAASLAGILTAWAQPDRRPENVIGQELAQIARDARGYLAPRMAAPADQPLPVARTIVSKSQ